MKNSNLYLKNEEKFGRISSFLYSFTNIGYLKKLHEFVIADILTYRAKNMLDIGCGPAYVDIEIAKKSDINVYCIDPSPYMLEIAHKNIHKHNINNIKIDIGSSRSIPFNVKFDLIISVLSFHHWKAIDMSLLAIASKLNPGSSFIAYEFNQKHINRLLVPLRKHTVSPDIVNNLDSKKFNVSFQEIDRFIKIIFTYVD